jgi:hypothetical protein
MQTYLIPTPLRQTEVRKDGRVTELNTDSSKGSKKEYPAQGLLRYISHSYIVFVGFFVLCLSLGHRQDS